LRFSPICDQKIRLTTKFQKIFSRNLDLLKLYMNFKTLKILKGLKKSASKNSRPKSQTGGDFYKSVEKVISGTGGKVWRHLAAAAAEAFPRSDLPGYHIPGYLDLAAAGYRIRFSLGRSWSCSAGRNLP